MKNPLHKDVYQEYAALLKLIANPKRLEIVYVLRHKEYAVEDLLKLLKVRKANLSQHLSILRNRGIVISRREGLRVYYSLHSMFTTELLTIANELHHKQSQG